MSKRKLNSILLTDCIKMDKINEKVEIFIDYSKNAKRRINCIYQKP